MEGTDQNFFAPYLIKLNEIACVPSLYLMSE